MIYFQLSDLWNGRGRGWRKGKEKERGREGKSKATWAHEAQSGRLRDHCRNKIIHELHSSSFLQPQLTSLAHTTLYITDSMCRHNTTISSGSSHTVMSFLFVCWKQWLCGNCNLINKNNNPQHDVFRWRDLHLHSGRQWRQWTESQGRQTSEF